MTTVSLFDPALLAAWSPLATAAPHVGDEPATFRFGVVASLPGRRRASLLTRPDGMIAAVTTDLADAVDAPTDEAALRAALAGAGVRINDPDAVFALTSQETTIVSAEADADGVRALTVDDAAAFDAFIALSTAEDVDEAYVELDHWLIVGRFVDGAIVAAASAYPWGADTDVDSDVDGTDGTGGLADIGVLTAPEYRGAGHARAVVRALANRILARGHVPQYRCQLTNTASSGAAVRAGFTRFATWECDLQDGDD